MSRLRSWSLFASLLALTAGCDTSSTAAKPTATPAPESSDAPAAADDSSPAQAKAEPPATPELPKAGEIHYVETVVGGGKPDDELPMIVAIHGLGDTPENFAHVFETFPEPARVILPRGIDVREGGGWSWFDIRARDTDVEGLAAGIDAAADQIAVAVDELAERRPTVGKPIVTGFSQGGMLTFSLAVDHPDSFAAAVPVGGWLPPPLWPKDTTKGPPILALHGTADKAVAFEPTKASVEHLEGLKREIQLKAYEGVGHALTPEIRRDLFDALVDHVRDLNKAKR